MVLRSQNLSGKYSHYSHTALTPACLLCYLHPSCFECSSIKSKADPLQEPTPSCIACQLRTTSLKGAVSAELKIFWGWQSYTGISTGADTATFGSNKFSNSTKNHISCAPSQQEIGHQVSTCPFSHLNLFPWKKGKNLCPVLPPLGFNLSSAKQGVNTKPALGFWERNLTSKTHVDVDKLQKKNSFTNRKKNPPNLKHLSEPT